MGRNLLQCTLWRSHGLVSFCTHVAIHVRWKGMQRRLRCGRLSGMIPLVVMPDERQVLAASNAPSGQATDKESTSTQQLDRH